jgi:hypothetical protein
MDASADTFEICAGSIVGQDHLGGPNVLRGKNNQDASHYVTNNKLGWTVGVVCDGCGGGEHSEVGAQIGARLTVNTILSIASLTETESLPLWSDEGFWRQVQAKMVATIRKQAYDSGSLRLKEFLDWWLFTIVGFILTPDQACVFSFGDGLFCINGNWTTIGPFENNQPPYLGYAVISDHPPLQNFQRYNCVNIDAIDLLIVGTDGVTDLRNAADKTIPCSGKIIGPLEDWFMEDQFFTNPDVLRRRLSLINRTVLRRQDDGSHLEIGRLPDDTTLIAVRRKPKMSQEVVIDESNSE